MEKLLSLVPPKIRFFNACMTADKLWFFMEKYNGLAFMDLRNMQMEYVDKVPGEDTWSNQLYSDIVHYKDSLILVPSSANEVAIYNIEKKKFLKVGVKEPPMHLQKYFLPNRKFKKAIVLGDSIYFLPNCYPAIVELNMLTGKLYYYNEWVEEVHRLGMDGYSYSANYPMASGSTIYMTSMGVSVWLEFDTDTKTTKVSECKNMTPCCCMVKTENKWMFIEKNGKIVFYSSDKKEQITGLPQELPPNIPFFAYRAITLGKKIYILTYNDALLQIDSDTYKIITIKEKSSSKLEIWGFICEYQHQLLYYDGKNGIISIYTEDGKLLTQIKVVIPDFLFVKNQISLFRNKGDIHQEGMELLLSEYLHLMNITDQIDRENRPNVQMIGNRIFDCLK